MKFLKVSAFVSFLRKVKIELTFEKFWGSTSFSPDDGLRELC